ncbi:MAG: hypothetical protein ACYTAN_03280 [Planctomycetota bacterium]|jgi:hypothetical protein
MTTGSAAEIRSDLALLRDGVRTTRIVGGFLAFAIVVAGGLFVFAFAAGLNIIPFLRLPAVRWAALIALVLAAGVSFLRRIARPLLWRPTYESLARIAEDRIGDLDNSLINAVQLSSERSSRSPFLLFRALDECLDKSRRCDLLKAVDRSALSKQVAAAAVVLAAVVLYAALAPSNFASGVTLILRPGQFVPAVGRARITEVFPGNVDVLRGSALEIEAVIEPFRDELPRGRVRARLHDGTAVEKPLLAVSAGRLRASLGKAEVPLEYMVEIEGTESDNYRIGVIDPPSVKAISVSYEYPEYTGLGHAAPDGTHGDISAPYGTKATVAVEANAPVASGVLEFAKDRLILVTSSETTASTSFLVVRDDSYRVRITDSAGNQNPDAAPYAVNAIPDKPPSVDISVPGKDTVAPPGSSVKVAVEASDDYGLALVELVLREGADGDEIVTGEWRDGLGKTAVLPGTIELRGEAFAPGKTYHYWARAADRNTLTGPGRAESPRYTIRIVDPEAARAELVAALRSLLERLSQVLLLQQQTHSATLPLSASDTDGFSTVRTGQVEIRDRTAAVTPDVPEARVFETLRRALEGLITGDMLEAIESCDEILGGRSDGEQEVAALVSRQQRIIETLKRILDATSAMLEAAEEGALSEGTEIPSEVANKLDELAEKLKEFLEAQRRIVEATSNLAARPVDDYTTAERDLLKEMAADEENWSNFLKEAWSDLSKLPEQDFSNPTVLKDLVETYSEVEMAADALSREAVVLAVPHEQAGLELAEELTTHLEKWLTDFPDRMKWEMEEPLGDFDVPMAELPSELQDIIGDLMEQEEDLFADLEDISSSWADSLDKGAGWDALDGPISNMSAQGVTGNVLPNSSEISGRSGEGRTGKAHGEFVGDSAVGKGGRRTPTRITPDDFLPGRIDDTSSEAAGGATGGGKESGAGEEGLQGPVPRQLGERLAALAGRQAQITLRTQKLNIAMTLAGYPNAPVEEALEAMTEIEESLRSLRVGNAMRRRPVVANSLKGARSVIAGDIRIRTDTSQALPAGLREEIIDGASGRPPRGYDHLLKGYYESLSVSR